MPGGTARETPPTAGRGFRVAPHRRSSSSRHFRRCSGHAVERPKPGANEGADRSVEDQDDEATAVQEARGAHDTYVVVAALEGRRPRVRTPGANRLGADPTAAGLPPDLAVRRAFNRLQPAMSYTRRRPNK